MRVRPIGPWDADIMLVGEAPGVSEEMSGRPFQGKSGREMRRLLSQAHIEFDSCFITNLVKLRPQTWSATGNNAPTAADIKRDEPELIEEIGRVRPEFIGAVGAVAARWLLLDRYDSIEAGHGLPFPLASRRVSQCGLNYTPHVVILTHPAAGLHQSEAQPQIFFDFQALGQYVRGELPLTTPSDQYPDPDYFEPRSSVSLTRSRPVYIDTEGLLGRVWGLSYTQIAGSAGVIRATNVKALRSIRDQLKGMVVVMHNALHDIPIIAELLSMSTSDFMKWIGGVEDTMVKAYVLRTVPLGLKPSSRRFHGMAMDDYLDVVRDADRRISLQFIRRLLLEYKCDGCGGDGQLLDDLRVSEKTGKQLQPMVVTCPTCEGDGTRYPSPEETIEYTNGVASLHRGRRVGHRLRGIVRDSQTEPEDTNPRKRWEAIDYEYRMKVEDVAGEMPLVSLNDVEPQSKAVWYSARDADATYRYDHTLDTMLDANSNDGLRRVYEIDRGMLPLLVRMMEVGTLVDVDRLRQLSNRLLNENDRILYKLERLCGRYVNPGSSKQVAELLFGDWKLPASVMTKGGDESTADKVLEDLKLQVAEWEESPRQRKILTGLGLITDHRERTKLNGSYADKLPRMIDRHGRVHTTFKGTNTESGRISSADPGLQQIPDPNKSELGGMVRSAFIAPPGYVLVECDYSTVEVRYAAHDSGDERLCRALLDGADIHTNTAVMLFDVPAEQITKRQRRLAKTITFSILYGITPQGLKARIRLETGLNVSVEDTAGYIRRYLQELYPQIGDYMLECYAAARRYGYAEDMFGRRRYLPGMHSAISSVKAEAERISVNHRIQASCASIMKLSGPVILDEVVPAVRKAGWDCDPLLMVHDSFLMQVECGGEEMLMEMMGEAMVGVVGLNVPLKVDGHAGESWGALKG